jgi:low temperature requirement protein LtrA
LELLFDLCFVVAVAQAARELNSSLAANHIGSGVQSYLLVFFAIWWAWVNLTWFASAHDVDDVAYRLLTFVQIVGVLILAAGVPQAFDRGDFKVATIGYVVMRVALVTQWLRAAQGDRSGRSAARRYASTIAVAVSVFLLVTGIVLARLAPDSVLKMRFIAPFALLLLVVGLSARGLSVGNSLPLMGLLVAALVALDRRALGLRQSA